MLNLNSPTLKFSISGLRGLVPEDINAANIPYLIRAYCASVGPGAIAIARDNRPTGDAIARETAGVLMACGRDVYDLGVVPTPTIKCFVNSRKLAGGIMISASHNPVHYNAFKFIAAEGYFFTARENEIWKEQLQLSGTWAPHTGFGRILPGDWHTLAMESHVKAVLKSTGLSRLPRRGRKLRVAVDTLSACATDIIPMLLAKLPVTVFAIHNEIKPEFPRPPEPVAEALGKLENLVRKNKCDVGFAFDPDADRLAIVSEKGRALGEEYTVPLFLSTALKTIKSPVCVNLSSSWLNRHVAEKFGVKFHLSPVGEANVVSEMQRRKSIFGGEGNGGVIDLRVPSLGRDAVNGVGWILRLMMTEKRSLSELVSDLPHTEMVKKAIKVDDTESLKKFYAKLDQELAGYRKDDRDGLHLSAPDGLPWVHLRPSNTEPIVRFIAETGSKTEMEKLLNLIR